MTIYDALAGFNSEAVVIPRNGVGKSKDGKAYRYAMLDDVINHIRPALLRHGLVYAQLVVGNELRTSLVSVNATAEPRQIDSSIPLGNPGSAQDMGSRITYMRRYALVSLLGLSTEDDTDAVVPETAPEPDAGVPVAVLPTLEALVEQLEKAPVARSAPHQKAWDAVQACGTEQALEAVRDAVVRSVKMNKAEKDDVLSEVERRETALFGTVR